SSFLERARGTDRQWALAAADRCRGVLLAAQQRLDDSAEALAEAVRLNEKLGHTLELGRALLAQGIVARRAKKKREADGALARAATASSGFARGASSRCDSPPLAAAKTRSQSDGFPHYLHLRPRPRLGRCSNTSPSGTTREQPATRFAPTLLGSPPRRASCGL